MASNQPPQYAEFNGISLIADRYRLIKRLGKGTFGEVFLADDLKFTPPRAVAIKMLHAKFLNEAEVRADIEREASVLARFNHANILRVIDFDISEEMAYIVTDLAEGGSLARKIRPNAAYPAVRMPLEEVAVYLEQIADALDDAHSAGLIHRDLKPLNILLTKRGRPLIADFGLATAVNSSQSSVLIDSTTSGTPPYMAPEQWTGHVGRASDIYALGIITFQLITGELPYQGSPFEIMGQHMQAPIPKLSERAPDLQYPPALDTVIAAAMAKEPRQRPRSAMEFYRRFREAISPFQTLPTGQMMPPPGTMPRPPGQPGSGPLPPPAGFGGQPPNQQPLQGMQNNLPPQAPPTSGSLQPQPGNPPFQTASNHPSQAYPSGPSQQYGGNMPSNSAGNLPAQLPYGGPPAQAGHQPPNGNARPIANNYDKNQAEGVARTVNLTPPSPVTVKKKSNLVLILSVVAGVLVVGVIAAGIFFLTASPNNGPSATATVAAVAATTAAPTQANSPTDTPAADVTGTPADPTPDTTEAPTAPPTTVAPSTTAAAQNGPVTIPVYSGATPIAVPADVSNQLLSLANPHTKNVKIVAYKVKADDSPINDFFLERFVNDGWTDNSSVLTAEEANSLGTIGTSWLGPVSKGNVDVVIVIGKGGSTWSEVAADENVYLVVQGNH